jgi:hypothetical protein
MMVAQNPVAHVDIKMVKSYESGAPLPNPLVLCANAVKQQDSQLQRRKIWTFVPISL